MEDRLNPNPKSARGRRLVAVVAAVGLAALSLAACSSSKSTKTSGTADSAGLTAAKALVAQYEKQPTAIPITTPIGKPIPSGKTIQFIGCGTPNCAEEGAIVAEAAKLIGWNVKTINTDGTPESSKNAFDQALRDNVTAVLYSAIEPATFSSELSQLKAKGIFLASCCTVAASSPTGADYAIDTATQTGDVGKLMAAWVIDQSSGSGDSVYVNLPAFPILSSALNNYKNYMSTNCPSCSVDTLDIPVTAIGKDVPTRIVSYLRSHPKVKYVSISTDSLTIGLPAALKAAGMNDIKIIGQGADTTNLQYIHAGQEHASVAFPYYEILWSMVDAAARHAAGATVLPSVAPTLWLLTKDNAPNATSIFPTVPDYKAQFEKLWGVS